MEILTATLDRLQLGPETTFAHLTVFPLLGGDGEQPPYRTLDEALAAQEVRIEEVSAGGRVPELRLVNTGALPVLLLDGEELVGAKQNRVVNLTLLAPAVSTLTIPVSCVEAGRWSHVSSAFRAAPRAQYAEGRASKLESVTVCMRESGQRHSDQHEVWSGIAAKAFRMHARSETGAMDEIFERHATSVEEYVRAFPAGEGQAGALFAIRGRIVGLDLFDHQASLRKLMPKLVSSYALDAMDPGRPRRAAPGGEPAAGEPAAAAPAECEPEAVREAAVRFLSALGQSTVEAFQAVGLGTDLRLAGEELVAAALALDGRLVHLGAFRRVPRRRSRPAEGEEGTEGTEAARMSPPSQRRRYRRAP